MRRSIIGLVSRICSYWRPHVDEEEVDFYRRMLKEANGRALEVACGGGRLLLRFLREGFAVEGVDSCPFLLDILQKKAEKAGLKPVLHHRKLEGVEIEGSTYKLVYIPLGSFQLISDREQAQLALSKYAALVSPGGRLVIALFLPWTAERLDTGGWQIIRDVRLEQKNQRYVERELATHDPVEQLVVAKTRFELWDGKDILRFDEREIHLRWYSQGEFAALLKSVGFLNVKVLRGYREGPPYRDSFMLFIAEKEK